MVIAKRISSILFVATFLVLASASVFISQAVVRDDAYSNSSQSGFGPDELPVVRDDAYSVLPLPAFVPGELLIKFKDGTSDQDVRNLLDEYGLSVLEDIPELGIKRLAVTPGAEEAMCRILSSNPLVVWAEPNGIGVGSTTSAIPKSETITVTGELEQLNAVPNASSLNVNSTGTLSGNTAVSDPAVPSVAAYPGETSLPNTGLNPLLSLGALALLFASAFVFIASRFATINH